MEPEPRFLVIYVYYEVKNFQKHQTNLSFFIRHGMNEKNWKHINIDYLFVVNGEQSEVLIPNEPNIYILKEKNCSNWEGWENGMRFMESKFGNLYEKYDYIYFITCSVLGPLIESNKDSHWILPYVDKIKSENSIICSNIATSLPDNDVGGPGIRLSFYNFLLKINEKVLKILRKELIININEGTKNKDNHRPYYNTVFGYKKDSLDETLTGEYGLSRILLKNRYTLSCLIYDRSDYQNVLLNNNLHPDRYLTFNGKNLPVEKIIFYKNLWKHGNNRICLPIEYNNCDELVSEYSNFNYNSTIHDGSSLDMDSSIVNSSLDTLVNTPSLKLISKIVKIGSKKSAFSKHSIFRNNKKLLFNYDTSNDINNDDTNDSTNGTNYDTTNDKQIINNTTNYNNTNLDINSKKSFNSYNIDYDKISINNSGSNYTDNNFNWYNKKDYYTLHGYAEEIITFPEILNNNKAVAIYYHYDKDDIIKDYVLHSLRCLILSGYDVIFCTSNKKINNVDLPFEINYFENYGISTDFKCYYEMIKKNLESFKKKYDYIFLANDSALFPINGFEHFKNVVHIKRLNSDFWAHWVSEENSMHFISSILEFKIGMLDDLLNFFGDENGSNILEYFFELGYRPDIVINCKKYERSECLNLFHTSNIYKWIDEPECFAIDWGTMNDNLDIEKINNPCLNYLNRYLHFEVKK